MARYPIPNQEGSVRQLNMNDTSGELWQSFNIDLHTEPGKIKLARPLVQAMDNDDLADNRVVAFGYLDASAYALTSSTLFELPAANGYLSSSTASSTPADAEDMTIFKDRLVLTTSTDLDAYDGNTYTSDWWTARGNPALTTNNPAITVPKILHTSRIGTEALMVTDGSQVHAYTGGILADPIVSVTVDLDEKMTACCLTTGIRSGWIGTYTETAEQAYVYEWDVASTNYTQAYPSGAKCVLAITADYNDTPVIITERGEIRMFNNAGFETIGQFPFANKPLFDAETVTDSITANSIFRPIHPKGIKVVGTKMFIFANWQNESNGDTPIDERTPAGLWVFDFLTRSLTHLCSPENESVFTGSSPIMHINDPSARLFVSADRQLEADGYGVWIEDLNPASQNYGHLTSVEIESASVSDSFDELVVKSLLGDNDEIVVKYRVRNDVSLPVLVESVIWTGAGTFNTTADLSAILSRFEASADNRDEVEIIAGPNAGRLCHITDISLSTNVYTVMTDADFATAGDINDVRVDNWRLVPKEMTSVDGEIVRFGIGETGSWIQYRIGMKGKAGRPQTRQFLLKTNTKES